MQFDNVRVSTRLWVVVLGLLLVLAVAATAIQKRSNFVFEKTLSHVLDLEHAIEVVLDWRGVTEVAGLLLILATANSDEEMVQDYGSKLKEIIARSTVLQAEVEKTATTPEMRQAVDNIIKERRSILEMTSRAQELRKNGDMAATRLMARNEMAPQSLRYIKAQDEYIGLLKRMNENARAGMWQTMSLYSWLSMGVIAVVVLLGVGLIALLVRSITQPLQQAIGLADAIGQGDLTRTVHTNRQDEMGTMLRSLSGMSQRLRDVVTEVRTGVQAVASASQEIASGNNDLSSRTEQTAANLEQTAASMEELTGTVATASETANQANQLAMTAAQAAQRGGQVVGQVVGSMEQITESSRRINDIISVIDGIAFQTNILALNAAVEAARAGDQGRGFAVVAGEVRSLAGRSAEAAKEIKGLIEASVSSVENGSQQVVQAGASMDEIVSSVQRVSDLIAEITAASTEQRSGITQVNQAVANLDQMTQQNAALVEQASAAASSMRDQSQRLAQAVSVFKVDQGGSGGTGFADSQAAAAPVHVGASISAPAVPMPAARKAAPPSRRPAAAASAHAIAIEPKQRVAAPASAAKGEADEWESF